MPDAKYPPPPKGLRAESSAWWKTVVRDYQLESSHLLLLAIACRAWDRAVEARVTLSKNGLTFTDRHGVVRPHPATVIEKNSSILFARMIRELRLGDAPAPDDERIPRNSYTSQKRKS